MVSMQSVPRSQRQTGNGVGPFHYPSMPGGIRSWDSAVRSEQPSQSPRAPTRALRRGTFLPTLLSSECQGLKCSLAWVRGLHRGLLVCKALGGPLIPYDVRSFWSMQGEGWGIVVRVVSKRAVSFSSPFPGN